MEITILRVKPMIIQFQPAEAEKVAQLGPRLAKNKKLE